MIKSIIQDGGVNEYKAKVTKLGQLVVAPIKYDETTYNLLDVDDTAYNFFTPKAGQQFVITGVIAYATLAVSDANATTIEVYEATTASNATVSKTLLTFGLGKLTSIAITPLNILVNEGVYVNAKTTDDDIAMTITGYYIEKLS